MIASKLFDLFIICPYFLHVSWHVQIWKCEHHMTFKKLTIQYCIINYKITYSSQYLVGFQLFEA